jgi:hypothetical protein
MSRRRVLAVLASATLTLTLPAVATPSAGPVDATPPAGAISSNVRFIANIPNLATAISINFLGDTMFVSTVHGVYSYDVSDPANPTLMGSLPMYIWENEDVELDAARKYLFISRDPRGFTSPATAAFPYGMVQVIDVAIPHAMVEIAQILLPSGHTTTCVDHCNYLWTAGPATGATQPADWGGRPVFATDLHDPLQPKQCPHAIDEHRNDGKTDYTHDVQVDARGIAWISGSGGIRGYWVSGKHRDPVDGRTKVATGCDPVPYAGGGTDLGQLATKDGVMHNSWRDLGASVDGRRGDVLYATEEVTVTSCAKSGRFAIYDLKGSYTGAGWRSTKARPYRLKVLSTWTPEAKPGSTGCDSSHYFTDRGDQVTANAFYTQGTRILDLHNPRKPKQIAYFRPDDADTWAAYWHKGFIFIADFQRGVDIIQLTGAAAKVGTHAAPTVAAPYSLRTAPLPSQDTRPSTSFGWLCA